MKPNGLELLRLQRARGPLPSSIEGLGAFVAALQKLLPEVAVPLPTAESAAISRLRAAGIVADLVDGRVVARFPTDGDALDRVLLLLGLPPLLEGGAEAVLTAIAAGPAPGAPEPPRLSLPLRIQPAKATALGWSSDLYSLTLLISNVILREEDGALLPTQRGPVVAVCAEYARPLTSLDPPGIADYQLERARTLGVPMLRLHAGGFLRRPLRLEATNDKARAPATRPEALARAEKFLGELDQAWQQRVGLGLEVAWPVFRPERAGPLLDGVSGAPLPEMQLA
jgi:hypothetical protein